MPARRAGWFWEMSSRSSNSHTTTGLSHTRGRGGAGLHAACLLGHVSWRDGTALTGRWTELPSDLAHRRGAQQYGDEMNCSTTGAKPLIPVSSRGPGSITQEPAPAPALETIVTPVTDASSATLPSSAGAAVPASCPLRRLVGHITGEAPHSNAIFAPQPADVRHRVLNLDRLALANWPHKFKLHLFWRILRSR